MSEVLCLPAMVKKSEVLRQTIAKVVKYKTQLMAFHFYKKALKIEERKGTILL